MTSQSDSVPDPELSRRQFLRAGAVTGVTASLAGCYATGGSGGGGGGSVPAAGVGNRFAYKKPAITKDQATHVVRNADQLDEALDQGTPERPAVVWVPPDAAINYSGRSRRITNAVGASTRTANHPGGLIYSDSMGVNSSAYRGGPVDGVFEMGPRSRLTGVRLRGPTAQAWNSKWMPGFIPFASGGATERENFREARFARGLTITSGSARVDNCSLYGWSTQGIFFDTGQIVGVSQKQSYPEVSHSAVTNCALSGYGYGLEVLTGHPIIRRCYLGACRHAVAGYGEPSGGYSLLNSFVSPVSLLFPVDYHNIGENESGSSDPSDPMYHYRAGRLIRIIGCSIAADQSLPIASTSSISQGGNPFAGSFQPGISIQGIPLKRAVIKNNLFVHSSVDEAISQSNIPATEPTGPHGFARFDVAGNKFGWSPGFPV